MEWKEFWFEGNEWYGFVSSRKDWEELKEIYAKSGVSAEKILEAPKDERLPSIDNPIPGNTFGFMYVGKETLGDFFEKNNMKI